jgi:Rrf2 family cysteine metabolism transcriptional repressor
MNAEREGEDWLFTISAKGVYGLTALVYVGMRHNRGAVQIRDIAESNGIPQHYLEQILVTMKKAGMVESYRGAQGGYALAKAPGQIRIVDVLTTLEGKLEIVPEQRMDAGLGFFWKDLERGVRELLELSLEDLILRYQQARNEFIYTI